MEKSIFARMGLATQEDKAELEKALNDVREMIRKQSMDFGERIDEMALNVRALDAKLTSVNEEVRGLEIAIESLNQAIVDLGGKIAEVVKGSLDCNSKEMGKIVRENKKINTMLKEIDESKVTKDDVETLSSFLRFIAANQLIQEAQAVVSVNKEASD